MKVRVGTKVLAAVLSLMVIFGLVAGFSIVNGNLMETQATETASADNSLIAPDIDVKVDYTDKINRFTDDCRARVDIEQTGGNGVYVEYYDGEGYAPGPGYYGLGNYKVKARSADGYGNYSDWTETSFSVTDTAPASPAIDCKSDYLKLINKFSDKCMIWHDISVNGTDADTGDSLQYEYSDEGVNGSGYYGLGEHTIKVRAIDEFNQVSEWANEEFEVALPNVPTASVDSPQLPDNKTQIDATSGDVTWNVPIQSATEVRVEMMKDYYLESPVLDVSVLGANSTATYTVPYTEGRHMFATKVTDIFGQTAFVCKFFVMAPAVADKNVPLSTSGNIISGTVEAGAAQSETGEYLAYINDFSFETLGHVSHANSTDQLEIYGMTTAGEWELIMSTGPRTAMFPAGLGTHESSGDMYIKSVGQNGSATVTGFVTGSYTYQTDKYVDMRFVYSSGHPSCLAQAAAAGISTSVNYTFIDNSEQVAEMWDSKIGKDVHLDLVSAHSVNGESQTMLPREVSAGDIIENTITVYNSTGDAVTGADIECDYAQDGFEVVEATPGFSNGKWSGVNFTDGESKTFSVKMRFAPTDETYDLGSTNGAARAICSGESFESNTLELSWRRPADMSAFMIQSRARLDGGAVEKTPPSNEKIETISEDIVSYAATFANNGDSTTFDNIATFDIPDGMEFVFASAPVEISGNKLTWNMGDMNSNTTRSISFVMQVEKTKQPTTWNITVGLDYMRSDSSAGHTDTNPCIVEKDGEANIAADIQQSINGGAMFDSAIEDVYAGDIIRYKLNLRNIGFGTAHDVHADIAVPDGLIVENMLPNGLEYEEQTRTIHWTGVEDMGVGEKKTIEFSCQVPETEKAADFNVSAAAQFVHVNARDAASSESNILHVHKDGKANIEVAMQQALNDGEMSESNIEDCFAGDIVHYEIAMKNTGFGTARNVSAILTVPDGMEITGDLAAGIKYDDQEHTLTIENIPSMSAGEEKVFVFDLKVPVSEKATDYAIQAMVEFTHTNSRNPASIESNILLVHKDGEAKIDISMCQAISDKELSTADIDDSYAGDIIRYEIEISNNGFGSAHNVSVAIPLPEGLDMSDKEKLAENAEYDENTRIITWTLGEDMQVGERRNIEIELTVPETDQETIYRMASLLSFTHTNSREPVEVISNILSLRKDGMPEIAMDSEHTLSQQQGWTKEALQVMPAGVVEAKTTISNANGGAARDVEVLVEIPEGLDINPETLNLQMGEIPERGDEDIVIVAGDMWENIAGGEIVYDNAGGNDSNNNENSDNAITDVSDENQNMKQTEEERKATEEDNNGIMELAQDNIVPATSDKAEDIDDNAIDSEATGTVLDGNETNDDDSEDENSAAENVESDENAEGDTGDNTEGNFVEIENGNIIVRISELAPNQRAELNYEIIVPDEDKDASWTYVAEGSYGHTNGSDTVSSIGNELILNQGASPAPVSEPDEPIAQTNDIANRIAMMLGIIAISGIVVAARQRKQKR